MSGGIVYDGVVGEEGGGGGTLFQGMKFWIALRVPLRSQLVSMVMTNGGEVVKLENQASVLIADHVRKDVPPGSVSWRFIELSVKNGKLEDLGQHVISTTADQASTSGAAAKTSSRPRGGGRSVFTKEDDDILMRCVLRQERRNKPIFGNKLYQELAAQHPNHPWQAWRDRWVKRLSFLPRPALSDEDLFADDPSDAQAAGPAAAPASRPNGVRSAAAAHAPARSTREEGIGGSSAALRAKFTPEDDELLKKYVFEAYQAGKSLKGNKIYAELAEEYPHHTAQSWRDRWVRRLSQEISPPTPRRQSLRSQDSSVKAGVSAASPPTPTPRPSPARRSKPIPPRSVTPTTLPNLRGGDPQSHSPLSTSVPHHHAPQEAIPVGLPSDAPRQDPLSIDTKPVPSPAPRQPAQGKASVERGAPPQTNVITSIQAIIRGALTRMALESDGNGSLKREKEPPGRPSASNPQVSALSPSSPVEGGSAASNAELPSYPPEEQPEGEKPPGKPTADDEALYKEAPNAQVSDEEVSEEVTEAEVSKEVSEEAAEEKLSEEEVLEKVVSEKNVPKEGLSAKSTPVLSERDKFYKDLHTWVDTTAAEVNFSPKILGKELELWELWSAVQAQNERPDVRDWEGISEALGYEWIFYPEVTKELKLCFDMNLREFEIALVEFDENSNVGSDSSNSMLTEDDDEGGDYYVPKTPQDPKGKGKAPMKPSSFDARHPSPGFTSSPPQIAGLKRRLDMSTSSSLSSQMTPKNKRARFAGVSEIPSTPDEKTGNIQKPFDLPRPVRGRTVTDTGSLADNYLKLHSPSVPSSPLPLLEPRTEYPSPRFKLVSKELGLSPKGGFRPQGVRSLQSPKIPGGGRLSFPSSAALESWHAILAKKEGNEANRPLATSQPQPRPLPAIWPTSRSASLPPSRPDPGPSSSKSVSRPASELMPPPTRPASASKRTSTVEPTPPPGRYEYGRQEPGFDGLVDRFVSMGYPREIVVRGLRAATMSPGEAGIAMESMMQGKGIPDNYEGLWTQRDDHSLVLIRTNPVYLIPRSKEGDSLVRRINAENWRLEHKHGKSRMAARAMFLRVWQRPNPPG